jgi:hypothetical protein
MLDGNRKEKKNQKTLGFKAWPDRLCLGTRLTLNSVFFP